MFPKVVLLLKIGPGKADISINNHTKLINLLKRRVFQLLRTLKVGNLKFWPQIWKRLGKSFPKMVLLLKIGPGKVVLFLNNRTQIINPLKKTVFQDLHTLKIENFKFWVKIWNRLGKSFPKMVLLLKIGSGKVVLFLNNRTQKIPPIPFNIQCLFLAKFPCIRIN